MGTYTQLGLAGMGLAGLYHTLNSPLRTRTRSEWLASFEAWSGPSSNAEVDRISRTAKSIRNALEEARDLPEGKISILEQGSSVNNTNVRLRSDLDIVIINETPWRVTFQRNSKEITTKPSQEFASTYRAFATRVHQAVASHLSGAEITLGNKAIRIAAGDSNRVDCDVLPSFRVNAYETQVTSATPEKHLGIGFVTRDGNFVISFPEQHLERGRKKNVATGYRYKQVVRVLKKLVDARKSISSLLFASPLPSSFELESLVFNVPTALLKEGDLYEAVLSALCWINNALTTESKVVVLQTVDGIRCLFDPGINKEAASLLNLDSENRHVVCQKFVESCLSTLISRP